MIDLQALINGMGQKWQEERAASQMTLGDLIAALSVMDNTAVVPNISNAHSYRGYYIDIAFEPNGGTRPAKELLAECRDAMGAVFGGYKGGDYVMGALTPVWVSHYGTIGLKLISISPDGKMETAKDES